MYRWTSIGVVVLALASCGDATDAQRLASARGWMTKQDNAGAVLELKGLLQQSPDHAEGRFLLGELLLAQGDPAAAEAELQRALAAKFEDQRVIPALAQSLFDQQKFKPLTDQFENAALNDSAASARVQALLAEAFLATGQAAKADVAIQRALQRAPGHPAATLAKAKLMATRNDQPAALAAVNALLGQNPNNADAWLLKGQLLRPAAGGDASDAIAAFRSAVAKRPEHVEANAALIHALMQRRDFAAAGTALNAMRKAVPNNVLVGYFDALLALQKGDAARALELAQQMLRGANNHAGLLMVAARAELQLNTLEQAEADAAKAVQLDPQSRLPRQLLAEILLRSGKAEKALAALKPLLDSSAPDTMSLALGGQASLAAGDAKAAQRLLARAAKANPDDPQIRTTLAMARLRDGADPAAFAELESIAKADKGTAADLALISAFMARRELAAAAKAVDQLALKSPKDAQPEFLRARIELLRGDKAAARKRFEAALAKEPMYLSALSGLVALDVDAKKPDAARGRLEDFINRFPRHVDARLALAGLVARLGGSKDEVTSLLEAAVKSKPTDGLARLAIVDHLMQAADNKAALAAVQAALAALPDNTALLDRLGRLQLAAGDDHQALATFGRWAVLQPKSALPHLRLADVAWQRNNLSAEAANARRALELEPDSPEALRAMLGVVLREKQPAKALSLARSVQARNEAAAVGYALEGEVEFHLGHFDAAVAAFRKAVVRNGGADVAPRLHLAWLRAGKVAEAKQFAEAWLREHPNDGVFIEHLGAEALARRDWAAAQARYEALLQRQPRQVVAMNNLALALASQRKAGAVEWAERAVAAAPNQPALLDTLAMAYASDDQFEQAVEQQRKAVGLAPQAAGLRLNLARLLLQAGAKADARAELEQLQMLGAAFGEQTEVQRLLKSLGL